MTPVHAGLITEDEVKKLKESPKTITLVETLEGRKIPTPPLTLRSGYLATYTIQDARPFGRRIELLSVFRDPVPDPADAEHIAKAILGTGFKLFGLITNAYRFYKIIESKGDNA